jgi:hypothetical protein
MYNLCTILYILFSQKISLLDILCTKNGQKQIYWKHFNTADFFCQAQ